MERQVRWCLVLACWLGVLPTVLAGSKAQELEAVRQQLEASMLVTGTIDIEPDGSVGGHAIDKQAQLPDYAVALIGKAAATWRFEPVVQEGTAVAARARMTLRLVAEPAGDDSYALRIAAADFGEYAPGEAPAAVSMRAPDYPPDALALGVTGTVYLMLRFGRDGKVTDVAPEQVNLRTIALERTMKLMRESLAEAALRAARRWQFAPPTAGPEVDDDHWTVRVPVTYQLAGDPGPDDGDWHAYIPGPRQEIPWRGREAHDAAPDALVAGGIYPVGRGLRLLTPLQPEG